MYFQGQYGYTVGANLQREDTIWGAIDSGHHVINPCDSSTPHFIQQHAQLNGNVQLAARLCGSPVEGSTNQHPALVHVKSALMADRYDNPVDLTSRHITNNKHNANLNMNGKRPHDYESDDRSAYTVNHNGVTSSVSVGIPNRNHGMLFITYLKGGGGMAF